MEFSWSANRRFNSYSDYIRTVFTERVQKISVDAGFTCPNRDNTKGKGGCSYCNNTNFRPAYIKPQISIKEQINQGIEFFSKKYETQKYLAYFQSFSNTYAPIQTLKELYEDALSHPKIVGLVISTRPDTVNEEILKFIRDLSVRNYVAVEYGIESTIDQTLERINRCHTYQDAINAIKNTAKLGIHTGAHMILGLPGESRNDIIEHAKKLSKLPIHTLKLHQLQINRNTAMFKDYNDNPRDYNLYSAEAYVELIIDFLEVLTPNIIIERFVSESPAGQLLAPKWGLKNFEVVDKIEKRLAERNTWQGRLYDKI